MPDLYQSLSHTKWDCKYHIVFIPKYRRKAIYGKIRKGIAIARRWGGRSRNFNGENFWARGYAVSTVGYELESMRKYIREQESSDQQGRF